MDLWVHELLERGGEVGEGLGRGPGGRLRGIGAVVGGGAGIGAEGAGDAGDGLKEVDGQLAHKGLVHDLSFHLFFPLNGQPTSTEMLCGMSLPEMLPSTSGMAGEALPKQSQPRENRS